MLWQNTVSSSVRHSGVKRTCRIAALLLAAAWFQHAELAAAFDLDDVGKRAQTLAREAYKDTRAQVPAWLLNITYDQWRDIRFRPDHALWRDLQVPFQVQFFHPGLYYPRTIAVNEVTADGVRLVVSSSDQFDYGK